MINNSTFKTCRPQAGLAFKITLTARLHDQKSPAQPPAASNLRGELEWPLQQPADKGRN